MLHHISVHTFQAIRHFDTQVFCQSRPYHAVPDIDLMTQTHGLDPAVSINRVADAHHGIREVDEPCVRTGLLHVVRDLHDWTNVACRMGKTTGSTILGIWLANPVFERDLE